MPLLLRLKLVKWLKGLHIKGCALFVFLCWGCAFQVYCLITCRFRKCCFSCYIFCAIWSIVYRFLILYCIIYFSRLFVAEDSSACKDLSEQSQPLRTSISSLQSDKNVCETVTLQKFVNWFLMVVATWNLKLVHSYFT